MTHTEMLPACASLLEEQSREAIQADAAGMVRRSVVFDSGGNHRRDDGMDDLSRIRFLGPGNVCPIPAGLPVMKRGSSSCAWRMKRGHVETAYR